MEALPASVQMIADVIGVDEALRLVNLLPRKYRKQNPSGEAILYVPKAESLGADHRLVQILGYPAALKLVRVFGGEILYPAICKQVITACREDTVIRFRAKGMRKIEIATMLQISERQVSRIIAKHISSHSSVGGNSGGN
jgi:hypothetical protein